MNSLNIDTTQFGKDKDFFFLNSPAMYLDFHDGNGLLSTGYLESEKTWRQIQEYAEFKAGIPKSLVRRDMIEQTFEIEGILKQFQKEVLALVMQRRIDTEDSTYDRVIIGTELPAPLFPSCVLVGKTVDGKELRLFIRVLQLTGEDLEIIMGGDEYSSIPFKAMALTDEDPTTTNPTWAHSVTYPEQDNIAFWAWPKP